MIVDRYYYAQLNKQEQAIYKAFYKGLMAHEDIIPIPIRGQLSKEVFNKSCKSPEISTFVGVTRNM